MKNKNLAIIITIVVCSVGLCFGNQNDILAKGENTSIIP